MSEGDTWVGKVLNEGLVDGNNCSSSVAYHAIISQKMLWPLSSWITSTLGDQREKAEKEHITTMDK